MAILVQQRLRHREDGVASALPVMADAALAMTVHLPEGADRCRPRPGGAQCDGLF